MGHDLNPHLVKVFARPGLSDRPIIVVGAGVSMASAPGTALSWTELIANAIKHARDDLNMPSAEAEDLHLRLSQPNAAKEILEAASEVQAWLIEHKDFGTWLTAVFAGWKVTQPDLIEALLSLKCRTVTTNYDDLLTSRSYRKYVDWTNRDLFVRAAKGDVDHIMHLHGIYSHTESVIFSLDDYKRITDDARTEFVEEYLAAHHLVFVGMGTGLEDPNFTTLLEWIAKMNLPYNSFRLGTKAEVACWDTYPKVWNVIYGEEHSDLPGYLRRLREAARREAATRIPEIRPTQTVDHKDTVDVVALSEDGRRLATAGKGDLVRLWDVFDGATAREVTTAGWPQYLGREAQALAFSPGAERVAAGGFHALVVWDVASGETIYQTYQGLITAVVLADGATLVSNPADGGVVIKDLAGIRNETVLVPPQEGGSVAHILDRIVKFSLTRDRRLIIASRRSGGTSLYVLPTAGDYEGQIVELYNKLWAESYEFDFAGNRLACIESTGSPVIYDTTRLSRATPQGLDQWISTKDHTSFGPPDWLREWCHIPTAAHRIAMSGDGRRVAIGHYGEVTVWDISERTAVLLPSPEEFKRNVSAIAVDQTGAVLAVATDTHVHLFEVPSGAGADNP